MRAEVIHGDCLDVLRGMEIGSVDAVITDPPYGIGFMGKAWDHGIPGVPFWRAVGDVLKPGGYMLVMGGTRTYHRLACAIEDAGFEIRDCVMWLYGSGFPKAKSCLKPAYEPILLARKPGKGMLPLGIDACRIPSGPSNGGATSGNTAFGQGSGWNAHNNRPTTIDRTMSAGRWPANVVHDGSDEVMEAFAAFGEGGGGFGVRGGTPDGHGKYGKGFPRGGMEEVGFGDTGTAARFFYCAKASRSERGEGNTHPTVKPLALMRWLCRLVTPPEGRILDPFAGSGTTGKAALAEGFDFIGIEKESAYVEIARRRIAEAEAGLFAGVA